jgi:hypothetical protein
MRSPLAGIAAAHYDVTKGPLAASHLRPTSVVLRGDDPLSLSDVTLLSSLESSPLGLVLRVEALGRHDMAAPEAPAVSRSAAPHHRVSTPLDATLDPATFSETLIPFPHIYRNEI